MQQAGRQPQDQKGSSLRLTGKVGLYLLLPEVGPRSLGTWPFHVDTSAPGEIALGVGEARRPSPLFVMCLRPQPAWAPSHGLGPFMEGHTQTSEASRITLGLSLC